MTRQTSKETYKAIINNGLLSNLRKDCYVALNKFGPATANELINAAASHKNFVGMSNIPKRLSELRNLGVVAEAGKRKCEVTGRNAIVWETTNNLPVKPTKKMTKKENKKIIKSLLRDVYPKLDVKNKRIVTKAVNLLEQL